MCPYIKHKSFSQRGSCAKISDIILRNKRNSATGDDLCWHTKKEDVALSSEQKKERYQWQKTKNGKAVIKRRKSH